LEKQKQQEFFLVEELQLTEACRVAERKKKPYEILSWLIMINREKKEWKNIRRFM
jgi:hypothetical protein